jgi:hypothetical protein
MKTLKKMPKETTPAFSAFKSYYESGENRSITELAKRLKKPVKLLEGWSEKWKWQERIDNFNESNTKENHALIVHSIEDISKIKNKKETEVARTLLTFLDLFSRKIETDIDNLEEMKLDELIKLITNYSKTMPLLLDTIYTLTGAKKDNEQNIFLGKISGFIQQNENALCLAQNLLELCNENMKTQKKK